MAQQLPLLEPDPPAEGTATLGVTDWTLDDRTREVGRKGVESARRALRAALRREAA